jgi:hypothetical protein
MVEPGTAAIATLAAVAGVSGYGAMKVNSNQDLVIEQKVQERIAQTEERLKQTQEALQAVEAVKSKQDVQLADIQKELELLRSAKANIEREKQPSMFKNPFTSRFSPTAPPPEPPKEPEPAPAPEPPKEPEPAPEPPKAPEPKRRNFFRGKKKFVPKPVPEPPKAPEPVPEPPKAPEPEAVEREVTTQERENCKARLEALGIRSLKDYRKWMAKNKDSPDIPEINNCVDLVLKGRAGGLRKKKLRTRRGGKQKNVRRTRRS